MPGPVWGGLLSLQLLASQGLSAPWVTLLGAVSCRSTSAAVGMGLEQREASKRGMITV